MTGDASRGSREDDEELGLREEDLDDVVFEPEVSPLPEATRWMAIARVHTDRKYI